MVAVAVLPVPPFVALTVPVVLTCVPAVTPVTFTENEHEPLAATLPPVKVTLEEPAAPVTVPPQEPFSPFGVATTKPEGKLSVNATPVSATPFAGGLVIVKVRDVEPPNPMLAAPNALAMTGGLATVRFADAVFPVPPLVELTAPVVFV